MTEIGIPETKALDLKSLKTDNCNPNRMNPAQRKALTESMKRYGFLVPIITNKDLVIADGEHRRDVAMGLGMEKGPVIRLDVKEVDRLLLRQVLNKLRGEHDYEMDVKEFERILKDADMETLELLTATPKDELAAMIKVAGTEPNEKEVSFSATEHECPKCGFKY